jgi:hypothetical protein
MTQIKKNKIIREIQGALEGMGLDELLDLFIEDSDLPRDWRTIYTFTAATNAADRLGKYLQEHRENQGAAPRGGGDNNTRRNKNNRRTNSKNNTRKQPFNDKNKYKNLHEKILSMDKLPLPFNLTLLQYADLIVERFIIMDLLNKIPITKTENLKGGDYTELQEGGVPPTEEEYKLLEETLVRLYSTYIEPFFRRYVDVGESARNLDIITSIIGGTFMDSIFTMLDGITDNTLPITPANEIYNDMIENIRIINNGLINRITEAYKNNYSLTINLRPQGEATFSDVKTAITYLVVLTSGTDLGIPLDGRVDTIIRNINTAFAYIRGLFVFNRRVNTVTRDDANTALNRIANLNLDTATPEQIQVLNNYMTYAIYDYLQLEYYGMDTPPLETEMPAAASRGGSRSRDRKNRRRRGSPRRRSLTRK